jgi:asparagine N-glycosylation enzyme membrane subunit Stt3
MNQFLYIFGSIVVVGYLLKIFFQMYVNFKEGNNLNIGPNNTIGWEYWKPIKMVKGSKLNTLRAVFNLIHFFAIIYLVILFLIVLLREK